MKRRSTVVVVVVLVVAVAAVVWRWQDGRGSSSRIAAGSASVATATAASGVGSTRRLDPKTIERGSFTGTVTDDGKAPIAGAQVCADGASRDIAPDVFREPACAKTNDQGQYTIGNLLPATYTVSASARTYRPDVHHPRNDKRETDVKLAIGERKTGIDIALRAGGVEITGIVSDLTGGPVAQAAVSAGGGGWWRGSGGLARGETDEQGRFSLWVKPGETWVRAIADGYADGSGQVHAPGEVEILLTPESSLSGTVVDAVSGEPIEGARVMVGASSEWGWDNSDAMVFTDAQGTFRASRLTPGRFIAIAKTEHGYGRTEGSTLVGLGQHVDGVVIKLWKAYRIEGKVVIASTQAACAHPQVSLDDTTKQRWLETESRDGGVVVAEAVLPGTYSVTARCRDYQSRDKYDTITITDKDVSGLVWEVDEGATIRGKIVARSGEPIEDVDVWATNVGGEARAKQNWSSDQSNRDGSYELTGLKAASYKLETSSDRGIAPKDGFRVDVTAGATIEKDLVLDDGGTIKGTVVDSEGKPVGGVTISAQSTAAMMWSWGGGDHKSDDSGTFQLDSLRPGDYRVTANRGWSDQLRKPGTTDDAKQGEKTTVRANQTSVVRLVVETQSGTIKGTVVDTEGAPIADAFVSAARESDAAGASNASVQQTRWTWEDKPVLTSVDGTFAVSKLSPGTYTLRAYRKGGGEAVAEHVAMGSTATLQIKATGSIAGTARSPDQVPDELTIMLSDVTTGFSRQEKFFRSNGQFVVRDLPKGNFRLTVSGDNAQKQIELDLEEGETKTGIVVELDALVTLTGRLVEHGTQSPVPAMRMMALLATGGSRMMFSSADDDLANITDETGRFTIKNAPRGKLTIRGFPKNFGDDDNLYGFVSAVRVIEGTGTVDIGDITVLKRRIKKGETVGELGVNFAEQPPATLPDQREHKVSYIDPQGPAAKTELKVGDIVTTIDGVDITGASSANASTLLRAPPGTKLVLGLARKATVEVTLAAP